jgi:hypothetical protein
VFGLSPQNFYHNAQLRTICRRFGGRSGYPDLLAQGAALPAGELWYLARLQGVNP